MAARPAAAKLVAMDRSLNGDDLRLLDSWLQKDSPEAPEALPPALDDLPGWFRQAVREEAAWLELEAVS